MNTIFHEVNSTSAAACGGVQPIEYLEGVFFFRDIGDAEREVRAARKAGFEADVVGKPIGFTQLVARMFNGEIEI